MGEVGFQEDTHVVMVKDTEVEGMMMAAAAAAQFAKVKLEPWKILLRCDTKPHFLLVAPFYNGQPDIYAIGFGQLEEEENSSTGQSIV